jgi:hypothetical protein
MFLLIMCISAQRMNASAETVEQRDMRLKVELARIKDSDQAATDPKAFDKTARSLMKHLGTHVLTTPLDFDIAFTLAQARLAQKRGEHVIGETQAHNLLADIVCNVRSSHEMFFKAGQLLCEALFPAAPAQQKDLRDPYLLNAAVGFAEIAQLLVDNKIKLGDLNFDLRRTNISLRANGIRIRKSLEKIRR